MSRTRRGTLSDEATLQAFERGVTVFALADAESCTTGAIRTRMGRARRARRRAAAMQADVFAGLRAAVERLEAQEARR